MTANKLQQLTFFRRFALVLSLVFEALFVNEG